MPRPSRPWFRFYVETVHDPKVRRRPVAERWVWVAILTAARQSVIPGWLLVSERTPMTEKDLADVAGVATKIVRSAVASFIVDGMLTVDPNVGCWQVTKWNERQFESDDVTERTRKHRSREQEGNVPKAFPGTPPEAEAENRGTYLHLEGDLRGWLTNPSPPLQDEVAVMLGGLRAIHGPEPVAVALTNLGTARFAYPSDLRKALERTLGNGKPPGPADTTAAATAINLERGNDQIAEFREVAIDPAANLAALRDIRPTTRTKGET